MLKILISIVLLSSISAFSSELHMYENKVLLSSTPVEKVVVRGPEIYVRSAIHACASYPGYPDKIYGDVYECYTSREKLSQHLNDLNILSLPDQDLSQYIIDIKQTFTCVNRSKPEVIRYIGKNVYWFSGLLLATTPATN